MHQSDYCMQTSVLKLSDTNMATAIHYLLAGFHGLFFPPSVQQLFSSKPAPQSAAQIKDHTAVCNLYT